MNKLKEFLSNQRNKKIFVMGMSVFVILLIFIVGIFLAVKILNRKITYGALEDQLINATSKYLKDHPEYYPTSSSPSFTVTADTLFSEKYLKKEIGKMVKDSCTANIQVLYKNDSYQVKPMLSCNNYQTQLLFDKVLVDNPVTDEMTGLYDMYQMLIFRGDKPNNYLKFNQMLWRIVKMDPSNSTIYLILEDLKNSPLDVWDNRYNTMEESKHGINNYDYSIASDLLENTFYDKFHDVKAAMLPMDICIGKRSEAELVNDSSVECSRKMSEQKYLSLLPLYDFINASYDRQCRSADDRACGNYNYLVNAAGKWWTLTADGSKGTRVFGINYTGVIGSDYADSKKYLRYVIAIDGNLIYSEGNGTKENPYVFK